MTVMEASYDSAVDLTSMLADSLSIDDRDKGTPDAWVSRHKDLIRLTGRHPFNCEPPLDLLMKDWVTPAPIHYVRNHGAVPKLEWDSHRLTVDGFVNNPRTFTMSDLLALPKSSFPVTLVCAGNRRKEQNMIKPSLGFSWGAAGVSTSVWSGVLLVDLIQACGGLKAPDDSCLYVTFEGPSQELPKGMYGTSVNAATALDPRSDLLIAFEMNGERLTPDHGYPVRVIIPGFIGGRMVKWLGRITVTGKETDSIYHYKDNRVLPVQVTDAEIADKDNWWYHPSHIINELNINSAISQPIHSGSLQIPLTPTPAATLLTLSGYAYTGGGRSITRVEVSFDQGASWIPTTLLPQPYPKRHMGTRNWCWMWWEIQIDVVEALRLEKDEDVWRCGEVCVRAWDSSLNTQPEKPTWNLMVRHLRFLASSGMMNNPWFRVRPTLSQVDDCTLEMTFHHPTVAGPTPGGWMTPGDSPWEYNSPRAVAPIAPVPVEEVKVDEDDEQEMLIWPEFTMEELSKHTTDDDCWIVVNGNVYDCTEFMEDHPGGASSILLSAATDATEDFTTIHSPKAFEMLKKYFIGTISPSALFLPNTYNPLRFVSCQTLTPTTRLIRFTTPQNFSLPCGHHVFLKITIPASPPVTVIRAYTPISVRDTIDFLIRIYGTGDAASGIGVASRALSRIETGGVEVMMKGPVGDIEYKGHGVFDMDRKSCHTRRIVMMAAGTGITPCWRVLEGVAREWESGEVAPVVTMLYANRSFEDVLMKEELFKLVADVNARVKKVVVKIFVVVSGGMGGEDVGIDGVSVVDGRVDGDMMKSILGTCGDVGEENGVLEGDVGLVCGSDGFVEACFEGLKGCGFDERLLAAF
ncbi:Oxidoreductase, molybdopterin-binding domain-containing protein [Chytridium lagenaria]|nr:Oxidoreductase, molybdopterin-binding domain-containing protein [Chytridium lagenaria]